MKSGKEKNHNLAALFLKNSWNHEDNNSMKMSLLGSIDGVSLSGNSRSKLWPVTSILLDLPTSETQRACNIIVHGLAEGLENPSTTFWNQVIPMIYDDMEQKTFDYNEVKIQCRIISWIADQPVMFIQ